MKTLTGRDLEDEVRDLIINMGLSCTNRLKQAQLKELNPSGAYAPDEHLEFDFLLPLVAACA